jgi:hypothetical protein
MRYGFYPYNQYLNSNLSKENWIVANKIIETEIQGNPNSKLFLSSLFTTIALDNNIEVFDNGQTEYLDSLYTDKDYLQYLFPESSQTTQKISDWKLRINYMVEHKEFALITINPGSYSIINEQLLIENYEHFITLSLGESSRMWDIQFWKPK